MKAATKVVMRTLTAGDRFRLVFCCLIAVLAGTSMGLSGEEDNPFESEDSKTTSTETDRKYVSPNTTEAVFSPVMLQLPSDTLSKVTTDIVSCLRGSNLNLSGKDIPLCQRLVWLTFQLAADKGPVKALDNALTEGSLAGSGKTGSVTRADLAATLVGVAKQCREAGGSSERRLAAYLTFLAADLDPCNKTASEAVSQYQGAGITPNWSLADGGETEPPNGGDIRAADAAAKASGGPQRPLASAGMSPAVCPGYERRPRAFARLQSKLTGLMVIAGQAGFMIGEPIDIIATVNPGYGQDTRMAFSRPVGTEMQISADEAIRAARVRYPLWESGRVTMSFGEKYSPKDGGSAGGAFTVLLLSLLDGVELDPAFAMTGDVTVDWNIRKVGAVTEKVRAAIKRGYTTLAVPMDNARDISDMTILYPLDVLAGGQVFGVKTVGEAFEAARKNRSAAMAQAMEKYAKVQAFLNAHGAGAVRQPQVQNALQEVLGLVPNHLSARCLLLVGQDRAPTRLSLSNSMQELFASTGVLWLFLRPLDPAQVDIDGTAYENALRDLKKYQYKLDREAEPLYAALLSFVTTLDKMHRIEVGPSPVSQKQTQLRTYRATLATDREKVIKVLRGLEGNKAFLERLEQN